MNELLNILSNSNKDIDNQQLMDYLSGKLSADERHDLEKQMSGSELVNDAVEGLENFKSTEKIGDLVTQLNSNLNKHLEKKKYRRDKRKIKDQPWVYLAVVIILALAIICFIVIKKHIDTGKPKLLTPPAKEIVTTLIQSWLVIQS